MNSLQKSGRCWNNQPQKREIQLSKLDHVNTTDIEKAIRLGCRTMQKVGNQDDHHIPYFEAIASPDAQFRFHPLLSEAHIPGRHLNALLNAEAIGIPLDDRTLENLRNAVELSFSGPICLTLNRQSIGEEPIKFLAFKCLR